MMKPIGIASQNDQPKKPANKLNMKPTKLIYDFSSHILIAYFYKYILRSIHEKAGENFLSLVKEQAICLSNRLGK